MSDLPHETTTPALADCAMRSFLVPVDVPGAKIEIQVLATLLSTESCPGEIHNSEGLGTAARIATNHEISQALLKLAKATTAAPERDTL